jgi:signal transduction histidine kinase
MALAQTIDESGSPTVINYTPKEYGGDPQNWAIAQDEKGMLYVGNSNGLLEFDGAVWRIYPVPNKSVIRSLAMGDSGKIYIGSEGDLGYFQPDAPGRLTFHSLLNYIPEANRDFANVWNTYIANGKVYFNCANYLFTWDMRRQRFSNIPSKSNFHTMFQVDGKIYIREWGKGLEVLENNNLSAVKGGDQFANERIYVMLPLPGKRGTALIGTRTMGLFTYNGKNFIPFKTEADEFIKTNLIYCGAILHDGTILLGTHGGAVLIDTTGKLLRKYNTEAGIVNNTIYFTFPDKSGAAWLATDNGISRIDVSSPVTYFDKRNNFNTHANDLIRYHGILYSAGNDGVHFLNYLTDSFEIIKNSNRQCFQFLNTGTGLLAATGNGLFKVEKDRAIPLRKSVNNEYRVDVLKRSASDTGRVYVGTNSGLWSIRREGNGWTDEGQIVTINDDPTSIVEDEDGSIWVGTFASGLYRIKFRKDDRGNIILKGAVMEHFDKNNGLQNAITLVYKINRIDYFVTADSIYRFNENRKLFHANTSDRLIADVYRLIQHNPILTFRPDSLARIWLQTKSRLYMGSFQPGGSFTWVSAPFNEFADETFYFVHAEKNGITWLGTSSMIVRYDFNIKSSGNARFAALVRQVTIGEDSTIYFGNRPGELATPEITYQNNSVKVRYAATSYEGKNVNRFKTMLEGFDKAWPAWSNETVKEYTNLPPGKYTFKVKAINLFDIESTVDNYSFEILPPWYRTWWAYTLYVLVFITALWAFTKWRINTLKNEKMVLEAKVAQRTKELLEEKEKVEGALIQLKSTQSQLIQSEKMASLGELTAGIAHEIQNPLNFVNNFSEVNRELISELVDEVDKENYDEVKLIANDIKDNSEKINHHGKRADAIVKGMLQHSRASSGQKELIDINKLADEYLRLSYHGMRARDKSFNAEFKTDFDESLSADKAGIGKINVVPQDIGRVLLNLYNNAFYAVNEKLKAHSSPLAANYNPLVSVQTKKLNDKVEIRVEDNGNGIQQNIVDKIFQPFFTTKPTGQGTGLGLSLAYDIIKAHGGEIKVETKEGEGSEFIIQLPV